MKSTALFTILLSAAFAADRSANPLVVHEWGTFTSVAGADGNPVEWAPLTGPPDLPCFVYTSNRQLPKGSILGRVRMETPVLYFYAPEPTTLSVSVDFPQGKITEWYPQASKKLPANGLSQHMEWNDVEVLPGAQLIFPQGSGTSHYYAARATDAAPLRIGDQQEKMIFYRGVGYFQVPVRPRITEEGKLEIRNAGPETVPLVIAFESQAGKVGYRIARGLKDTVMLEMPELTGDLGVLQQKLAMEMVEFGLYQKEAAAMIETWRDSWFEDGMRVFYIVPSEQVDALLPLKITPAPASVGRVFVGRVEVLSGRTRRTIENALRADDTAALVKMGRFLRPFAQQINRNLDLARAEQEILSPFRWDSASCVQ